MSVYLCIWSKRDLKTQESRIIKPTDYVGQFLFDLLCFLTVYLYAAHYDSSYLIPASVAVFPCQRRMRQSPVRAGKASTSGAYEAYEAYAEYEVWTCGAYTVCGSIPASICILVDNLAWSRPYVF